MLTHCLLASLARCESWLPVLLWPLQRKQAHSVFSNCFPTFPSLFWEFQFSESQFFISCGTFLALFFSFNYFPFSSLFIWDSNSTDFRTLVCVPQNSALFYLCLIMIRHENILLICALVSFSIAVIKTMSESNLGKKRIYLAYISQATVHWGKSR